MENVELPLLIADISKVAYPEWITIMWNDDYELNAKAENEWQCADTSSKWEIGCAEVLKEITTKWIEWGKEYV